MKARQIWQRSLLEWCGTSQSLSSSMPRKLKNILCWLSDMSDLQQPSSSTGLELDQNLVLSSIRVDKADCDFKMRLAQQGTDLLRISLSTRPAGKHKCNLVDKVSNVVDDVEEGLIH